MNIWKRGWRVGSAQLLLLGVGQFHGGVVWADEPTQRQVLEHDSPLRKMIGEVANGRWVGDAWFVGTDGCNIVTNFHVALGKGKTKADRVEIVDEPLIGHKTSFHYDFNAQTGGFRRNTTAVVTDIGNYENGTMAGLRGDLAILRLEQCAGPEYAGFEIDRAEENQGTPPGKLMTLSLLRTNDGRRRVAVQMECRATLRNPAPGLIAHSCEVVAGMSGSPVLVQGMDLKWRVVAVNTKDSEFEDKTKVGIGIAARVLNKFLDEARWDLPR